MSTLYNQYVRHGRFANDMSLTNTHYFVFKETITRCKWQALTSWVVKLGNFYCHYGHLLPCAQTSNLKFNLIVTNEFFSSFNQRCSLPCILSTPSNMQNEWMGGFQTFNRDQTINIYQYLVEDTLGFNVFYVDFI